MTSNNTFGEYLKKYREINNLSISELHRKTGVSQPYLSQLEKGKTPSKKIIQRIAAGLTNDIEDETKYETFYNELLVKAGYIGDIDVVNTEAREYMINSLEEVMSEMTTNNSFFEFIQDEIKTLEHKYKDVLDVNETLTPDWIKNEILYARYDDEWIYGLISDLRDISKKYNLHLELQAFLLKEGITYRGILIDDKEKQLIKSYLEALFSANN